MKPFRRLSAAVVLSALALFVAAEGFAVDRYVSPQGSPEGDGTRESPWDIASTLNGEREVNAGDTVYLTEGVYRRRPNELFDIRLVGAESAPIHVRPAPGERAVIDGGLVVQEPSAHVWIWELELVVTEPNPPRIISPGSHPEDLDRPSGGLHMLGGDRCKFINLVIHDCRQGVSFWLKATNMEMHGCIIYDNGWLASDRGHGHAVYTQNDEGIKTISDCIMTGGFSYTMHAYGSSRAYVNNYLVEGNICYEAGTFLIGGGRPSHGIRVRDNLLYNVNMRMGYDAPHNEDIELRDNLIVNGKLDIVRFREVVIAANEPKPDEPPKVVLRRNRYDPNRAHLAVFNWDARPNVAAAVDGFLKVGERYRLLDPRFAYGPPIRQGVYNGASIPIPMDGEFAAFILINAGSD